MAPAKERRRGAMAEVLDCRRVSGEMKFKALGSVEAFDTVVVK